MTTTTKIIVSVISGLSLVLIILMSAWMLQTLGPNAYITDTTSPTNPSTITPAPSPSNETSRALQELPLCPVEQTTIGMVRALQDPASICRLILVQPDGLEQLAANADKFPNLKTLEAAHGQYREVPADIGRITSLIVINLNDNYLTTLPDSIGQLPNLSLLQLKRNAFSENERTRIKSLTPAIIAF